MVHPFAIILVIVAILAALFIFITLCGMTYGIASGTRKLFDRNDRRRGFDVTPTAEANRNERPAPSDSPEHNPFRTH